MLSCNRINSQEYFTNEPTKSIVIEEGFRKAL